MQVLKSSVKRNFGRWLYRRKIADASKKKLQENTPQYVKVLPEAAFDIFTDGGEDGIIYYLLQNAGEIPPVFVDIGSGDCIKSNCAALAVHFGWKGVFIDRSRSQLDIGRRFYRSQESAGTIRFTEATVDPGNVNQLIREAGVPVDIGLLSIDIDGNDYWVWKAIECIKPRIVVIEAKVEFGFHNVVVPYGPANHRSNDKMYNGASVEALRILGKQKGYGLAGANKAGYNLFFVKETKGIQEADTATVLSDPGTIESFYPESFFSGHRFEKA